MDFFCASAHWELVERVNVSVNEINLCVRAHEAQSKAELAEEREKEGEEAE